MTSDELETTSTDRFTMASAATRDRIRRQRDNHVIRPRCTPHRLGPPSENRARLSPDRCRFATLQAMATASTKVLSEALKLSVQDRVRIAEKLLESADAEGYEDESEVVIHAAWADEIKQRSGDLKDGSVRGWSIEEARRIVASEPADDDR